MIVIYGCELPDLEIPAGAQGLLTKPVRPEHLLGALEQIGVPIKIQGGANG